MATWLFLWQWCNDISECDLIQIEKSFSFYFKQDKILTMWPSYVKSSNN